MNVEIFYSYEDEVSFDISKTFMVGEDGSLYSNYAKINYLLGNLGKSIQIEEEGLFLRNANTSFQIIDSSLNQNNSNIIMSAVSPSSKTIFTLNTKGDVSACSLLPGEASLVDTYSYTQYPSGQSPYLFQHRAGGCIGLDTPADSSLLQSYYWWDSYICNMYTKKLIPTLPYKDSYNEAITNSVVQGSLLGTSERYWDNAYINNAFIKNNQSDERVKESIEKLSNQYNILFDNLQPVRYKYKAGTSDRYHTGFIAQKVVEALDVAQLSTKEFAAVVLNEPNTENECWFLRRDEFIALNTDQIQKLKPRVSTLEQTILNYESRISNLETEIQNLKSSQNSDII